MNSIDMMHNLINRAKHLYEFVVTTDVPEDFRFNGEIPFDIQIKENVIYAKVWGIDFDEAVSRLNEWLETCK
jgi:hypothetical protein